MDIHFNSSTTSLMHIQNRETTVLLSLSLLVSFFLVLLLLLPAGSSSTDDGHGDVGGGSVGFVRKLT